VGDPTLVVPLVAVRAASPADARAIAAIWNFEVRFTDATTDTAPRDVAAQRAWLAARNGDHPAVVAVRGDEVVGFGALSAYRAKPAFRHTVEDSVYVKRGVRGQGVGAAILGRLVELARERGHRSVLARITAGNAASIRLHERLGFARVGLERETAYKLGRWLDVVTMQLMLDAQQPA
jgi:phosphinothricin acetyltransferase